MKKIVGILGMAAVLATSAFAADPAVNFAVTKFDGSASLDYVTDFQNEKMGFKNANSVDFQFGLFTAGDKITTGDGVWGELKISTDGKADGLTKFGYETAAKVDTAKIHFVDGDFNLALNILNPSLKLGDFKPAAALPGFITGVDGIGNTTNLTVNKEGKVDNATGALNGFTLTAGYGTLFTANFALADNGWDAKWDAKKYGMAFDATVTPITDLTVKVGTSMNFDEKYYGVATNANYKFGITDKLYVTPGVGFEYESVNKVDTKNLSAGVLFGWGAADVETDVTKFIPKAKQNEGLSATVWTNMEDNGLGLTIGLYDQSLLTLLDEDGAFGTLKTAVAFLMPANKGAMKLDAGLVYNVTVSDFTFDANFGLENVFKTETTEATTDYVFGAGLTYKGLDNTDIYTKYDGGKDNKGVLTVGTKIHF